MGNKINTINLNFKLCMYNIWKVKDSIVVDRTLYASSLLRTWHETLEKCWRWPDLFTCTQEEGEKRCCRQHSTLP